MNTRDINGSSWPIGYFIAVAVPLTVLTILTPLYALRIFNIITRLLQGDARVRRYFKWGIFSLGILLAFISAILESVDFRLVAFAMCIPSTCIALGLVPSTCVAST
ncbi:hypothetical protein BJX66DRAFT_312732 [Aspergillus keveii]|uniref:Uncharacterized protein n=1 Tax=Aspergillus keveii TaxID=714993 RepID=A0ABR4FT63_9EURO